MRWVLGLFALAIALLVLFWDWNWFKGPIERRVEARTGREFKIGGDLDVDLGRISTVRADGLKFGNSKWSKEPTMAASDRLEFRIETWPWLLGRETAHPRHTPEQAAPALRERCGGGVGNWNVRQGRLH